MLFDTYKQKIISFYKQNKRVPGYQEIMSLVGFKSKNAVYKLLNKLVDEGVFTKDSRGKLIPNKLHGEVPVLGLVEAGLPTTAEEAMLDTISIDEFLINEKATTYMLEVKGQSMIDAHIEEGDLVLVEKTEKAKIGDIVIADVDGGWTMKYYQIDKKGQPFLRPANESFKDIYPEEYLRVAAIVKAVIRKY
ncbi:MAG: S24 family peptidase [Patescibacteria group bacterium]